MSNILLIESSKGIRNALKERLEYESHRTAVADTVSTAAEILRSFVPDVVLCDHYDPQIPPFPLIVLSDSNSLENALKAARTGACDIVPKPIDMNRLLSSIKKAVSGEEEPEPQKEVKWTMPENKKDFESAPSSGTTRVKNHETGLRIIGSSKEMARVKSDIELVAPYDARVLISGENGTGKELVARTLHHKSNRSTAPFVEINCAAIPSELIESELFGHEKGSFTSAVRQRKGKFEQADGGTLFMDEIGDMSLSAQAKVLRALQERRICRVGSDKDIEVNVRVLAATNKNLKEEIRHGRFREDLYHRLSVVVIHVPPLRARVDDIAELVESFMETICDEYGVDRKSIDAECIEEFAKMPWHGNVRELRNVVERLIVFCGTHISLNDVKTYVNEYVI